MDFRLEAHQEDALKVLETKKNLYLDWKLGKGKTFLAIEYIKRSLKKGKRCMVVCPRGVFSSFSNVEGDNFDKPLLLDTKIKRDSFLKGLYQERKFVIMNYEFFSKNEFINFKRGWVGREGEAPSGYIMKYKPDVLIFDEAHQLKNPKSKMTQKAMATTRAGIESTVLMSGTPIGRCYTDIWSQLFILDKGKRLGRSYYTFLQTYLYDVNIGRRGKPNYFPDYKFRPELKDQMLALIGEVMHTCHTTDEEDNMPSLKNINIKFSLSDEQKKLYNQTKETCMAMMEKEGFKVMDTAIELTNTLRQICCGFFYLTDIKGIKKSIQVKNNRLEALQSILSQIREGEKTIIWTVYKETYKHLAEYLKDKNPLLLVGGITTKKLLERIDLFKRSPSHNILIAHPKSAGAGLNLQEAKHAIYYSQDYSFISKKQSEGRNFRRGSSDFHNEIFHYYIESRGTIEADISKNIKSKRELLNYFRNNRLTNL